MKNIVIGTAGHIDHGKTMLIKALTGTDTDRLKIEKERGISIELGYAFCRLPSGRRVGIVDVPGHERFIKNMLAGVGGIDLVLLVIAADEGIMPQTREHMDIIELLQINRGVVALTKIDIVDDELLALVREEVHEFLKTTSLKNAPVVEVSPITGKGLPNLLEAIDQVSVQIRGKKASGPVRLPIDRAFTVSGFGTVVTGTLWSGVIRPNDILELAPQGLNVRVRSLQVHGEKVSEALAGQRVAINIPGIELSKVKRGNVLVQKNSFKPSLRLDVKLYLLDKTPKKLVSRARVRFYLGTSEILGRVLLFNHSELAPGQMAYAQLILEEPTVAKWGDRFILRSYSPMRTIGGGLIINPVAGKHKGNHKDIVSSLVAWESGNAASMVMEILKLEKNKLLTAGEMGLTEINPHELEQTLTDLSSQGKIKKIRIDDENYYVSNEKYQDWVNALKDLLYRYHQEYPLREGLSKEELRSRLFPALNSRQIQYLLEAIESQGLIKVVAQKYVAAPDFRPNISNRRQVLENIEEEYKKASLMPPRWTDVALRARIATDEAQEFLNYFLRRGILVKVGEGLYFHHEAIQKAKKLLLDYFSEKNELTVGEARDVLQISRKYTLPLLEYFDQNKVTKRIGDKRVAIN